MELRHLRTFLEVAAHLSFHRAAARLNYAQSSASAHVRALEEDLGTSLFERRGRSVALTPAGERLVAYARKMTDLAEEARAETLGAANAAGSLTVRVPETLCAYRLPGAIARFQERFPGVRLRFTACAQHGLTEDLRKGLTDLAFLYADAVSTADLTAEVLGVEEALIVAAPEKAPAGGRADAAWFARTPLFMATSDCSYRRLFGEALADCGIEPRVTLFSSVMAAKRCAALGFGAAVLPMAAVEEELASGVLSPVAWEGGGLEAAIMMLSLADRRVGPALGALMEMCREALAGIS